MNIDPTDLPQVEEINPADWGMEPIEENQIENIVAQIRKLESENFEITKAGGFFTEKQMENGRESWKLRNMLRFSYCWKLKQIGNKWVLESPDGKITV